MPAVAASKKEPKIKLENQEWPGFYKLKQSFAKPLALSIAELPAAATAADSRPQGAGPCFMLPTAASQALLLNLLIAI